MKISILLTCSRCETPLTAKIGEDRVELRDGLEKHRRFEDKNKIIVHVHVEYKAILYVTGT